MIFWVLAAMLALAATGFALAPFLRRGPGGRSPASAASAAGARGLTDTPAHPDRPGSERDRTLRALYRQRVEELEEESAAGILDESSRLELEQELGQGLLDEFAGTGTATGDGRLPDGPGTAADEAGQGREVAAAGSSETQSTGGRRWLLLAVAVPLLALVVYVEVGEPDAARLRDAPVVLQLDPERDRLELDRWRVLFADRLQSNPDDAQTRYLLGRIYLGDGEYQRAAASFALAHAVVGDDPSIDLAWLQALYLADQGWLDEQGRRIAGRILERDPNQPMVLEMLAIDAYRRGDYRDSVGQFSRALSAAVDPLQRTALELFLKQARSMLGDLLPSIDVELNATRAPPMSATLFVIARPVGGGMPFAVVRRAAMPLPDRVRLDDAVSMNPALPLSAASEIEVVVRISLTGAAMPHPGDWEWRSEPLAVAASDSVTLVAELRAPARSE